MRNAFDEIQDRFRDWVDGLALASIHRRVLILIFLAVLGTSAFFVSRGQSQPVIDPIPVLVEPAKVVVDVAGGVKSPGVYELPATSRVTDAIKAAGGALPGTDTSDINLARIIKDGEQIYIEPVSIPNAPTQAMKSARPIKKKSGPININRATASELDTLPGIGPVLASRIIEYRKTNGPFLTVDDLQKVSGIGSAKFAQFKGKVRA